MPLYEYVCPTDGETIELLRPMAEADKPVTDPKGLGRVFERLQSTFASKGSSGMSGPSGNGGCCPCGKNKGSCGSN